MQLLAVLVDLKRVELDARNFVKIEEAFERYRAMLVDIVERRAAPGDADMQLAIFYLPTLR